LKKRLRRVKRKTERQKDRKTERQKDRQTERQKDKKTEEQEPVGICLINVVFEGNGKDGNGKWGWRILPQPSSEHFNWR
jgi:hypothetical protein